MMMAGDLLWSVGERLNWHRSICPMTKNSISFEPISRDEALNSWRRSTRREMPRHVETMDLASRGMSTHNANIPPARLPTTALSG